MKLSVFVFVLLFIAGPGLPDFPLGNSLSNAISNAAIKTENSASTAKLSAGEVPGNILDRFNGIPVYYNGKMTNVFGRNVTHDGYNLGLKYQCVEYVKRYYYYRMDHKMTDSYGHAKQFFDGNLPDTKFNEKRGLYQFRNGSKFAPEITDIMVFNGDKHNPFGHMGIVTDAGEDYVEIIQQNVGTETRARYKLYKVQDRYYVDDSLVLGWLRKA